MHFKAKRKNQYAMFRNGSPIDIGMPSTWRIYPRLSPRAPVPPPCIFSHARIGVFFCFPSLQVPAAKAAGRCASSMVRKYHSVTHYLLSGKENNKKLCAFVPLRLCVVLFAADFFEVVFHLSAVFFWRGHVCAGQRDMFLCLYAVQHLDDDASGRHDLLSCHLPAIGLLVSGL